MNHFCKSLSAFLLRDSSVQTPTWWSLAQGLLQWLQRDSMDGFWAGLIFEQTWSYIFGAGPTYQHPEECAMYMCDPGGEAVVPDWRAVVHKRRRRRGLRSSRRHQAH